MIKEECHGKYGAMMDGTVDVSGTNQMNIVVRFVWPMEKFKSVY